MRRLGIVTALLTFLTAVSATAAFAVSNAHFVGTPTATRDDTTLTISGKVAGLGQVEVVSGSILPA